MTDMTNSGDPYRVDPAQHRGRDIGILERLFKLPRDRRPSDHRGPRRLDPEPDEPGEAEA